MMLQSQSLGRLEGIRHGFFTREGGVSDGIYASLNGGIGSKDDQALVAENRARMARALDVAPDRFIGCYQIHSPEVVIAERAWTHADRPKADAIVTNVADLAIGVSTADCGPLLFADEKARVIGAAHAGWRGAVTGIAEATVLAMVSLGADPERIVAAIGPTISEANYEVGPEWAAELLKHHRDAANRISTPEGGREHFDLPGFVFDHLIGAGVGVVDDLRLCTYAEPRKYFSHRWATHKGIPTGRQLSIIGLGGL